MTIEPTLTNFLVQEAVRQIKMRPYLSKLDISSETIENWGRIIASTTPGNSSPLTRFEFNSKDYELNKEGRVISLHLRGIIDGEQVNDYYKRLVDMGREERRFFGKFSSEYEFDSMIKNEFIRQVLASVPGENKYSLIYRLNDENPQISGSGHRKRRPLLVCPGATDEEVQKINEIEMRSTKKWGYSDYTHDQR